MEDRILRRTWAEIDLDALAHNYHQARKKTGPGVRYLGVVKADAYGHGAVQIARKLEELGADYLAVSSLDEARELRGKGIAMPILILGHTPPAMVPELIRYGITQTWPGLIGTMIVIQPPACLASAFIYTYTYGGFAGSGLDIMHAVFMQASQSIFAASFISELVTGFLDKTVLIIVLMLVFRALPEKFRVCTPFKGKKDDNADDE